MKAKLYGVAQSWLTSEEIPALAAARIHWVGIANIHYKPRRRPIDIAQHRILQITMSGTGRCLVNGRWVSMPAGAAYIIPKGAEWAWRYEATDKPWEQLFVVLEPEFELAKSWDHAKSFIRRRCDPTDLAWTYRQLYKETLGKSRLPILVNLCEIVACLSREIFEGDEHRYLLSNLWVVVANDLSRTWTLDSLSKEAGMCQEKLRMLCHNETGRSPIAQVTYLRMRQAALLIKEGHLKVKQIGAFVGYDNPFNFSLAFKRHYGMSPAHFRKKQRPEFSYGAMTSRRNPGSSARGEPGSNTPP